MLKKSMTFLVCMSFLSFAFVYLSFTPDKLYWKYQNRSNPYKLTNVSKLDRQNENQSAIIRNFTNGCSLWKCSKNWKYTTKPRIILDPDKFVYPGLIWGPNNQIIGLKQSIYLAIRLNRTLAIPMLMSHHTSEGGVKTIPPNQRIDVERMCQFVSCISIPDMKAKCDGAFDVALQAKATSSYDLRRFERDTGMDIVKIKKKLTFIPGAKPLKITSSFGHVDIPALPNNTGRMFYENWLSPDVSSILKAFDTSARCAIYTSTFRAINISVKNDVAFPLKQSITKFRTIPDDVLYSAVTYAIRHPPCIVEAAKSYVKNVLNGEQYVAVHWRYDKGDWQDICPSKIISPYNKEVCRNVFGIQPKDLARGIASSLPFQNAERSNTFIYIATPTSLKHFKEETYLEFKNFNNSLKKPPMQLKEYVDENFKKCWVSAGWLQTKEVVSLVEMEIMRLSSWFFNSDFSTWSDNVIPLRSERLDNGDMKLKFTKSAYQVAYSQMKLH